MIVKQKISKKTLRMATLALVAYLGIFGLVLVAGPLFDGPEVEEERFDMTQRLPAPPSMAYWGDTYYFRTGEVENVLVLGVDGSEGLSPDAHLKGQADTLMVMSIDRKNRRVTPVVIDRDTMASVQLYGIFGDAAGTDVMQVCLAHAFSGKGVSGGENTRQAVSTLLGGLPIDHYMTVDLPGMVLLNDAVGGVLVTLDEDFTDHDPAMKKGTTMKLMGHQAELYLRGRMNVQSGTNHFRMQRQMNYLPLLMQRLADQVRSNPNGADNLFDLLKDHSESNLGRAELILLAKNVDDYQLAEPIALQGTYCLGADNAMEFYLDTNSTAKTVIDLCYERGE